MHCALGLHTRTMVINTFKVLVYGKTESVREGACHYINCIRQWSSGPPMQFAAYKLAAITHNL